MNFWTSIPQLWQWMLVMWLVVFPLGMCVIAVKNAYRREHPKPERPRWQDHTVTRIYPDSRQSDSVRPKDDV